MSALQERLTKRELSVLKPMLWAFLMVAAFYFGRGYGYVEVNSYLVSFKNERGFIGCVDGAWQVRNIDIDSTSYNLPHHWLGLLSLDNAWCKKQRRGLWVCEPLTDVHGERCEYRP